MLKRESAKEAFKDYISNYDCDDPQIKFKIEHTYHVAELSWIIGASVDGMPQEYSDLCWLIGLLHDIGRFEQLKRYGTFSDSQSVDHAELGADILFKDGVIEQFFQKPITDMTLEQEREIIELAIRNHNKYRMPEGLDEQQLFFCNVIRDADKIDIFRVVCETPFELRMCREDDGESAPAREEVMNAVVNHTSVRKLPNMTSFEATIMGCAMAFDIVFDKSREIIKSQRYLKQILTFEPKELIQKQQMELLGKELSFLC
ncbi:MAG: HD domain-containing protein [Lachnospiraceae bacterium]|nr:HD domain-containing protein [Lachnospiraceae bacterium]